MDSFGIKYMYDAHSMHGIQYDVEERIKKALIHKHYHDPILLVVQTPSTEFEFVCKCRDTGKSVRCWCVHLKPYRFLNLCTSQRIFNYHLSRARQCCFWRPILLLVLVQSLCRSFQFLLVLVMFILLLVQSSFSRASLSLLVQFQSELSLTILVQFQSKKTVLISFQ